MTVLVTFVFLSSLFLSVVVLLPCSLRSVTDIHLCGGSAIILAGALAELPNTQASLIDLDGSPLLLSLHKP